MCFAPQRRALFRHRNFQKWSDAEVFCTFWLGNVLRATTACTFSTSQLPKVVREWCVLYILTSKCASRHNGVHFFISHLASWLRTRRFSEPTFRPSGATNHWENPVFRDFPTFSRICIFCLLTLSLLIFFLLIFLFSLPLPCSAFHLSILSEVWLLNFLRQSLEPLSPVSFGLIRAPDDSSPPGGGVPPRHALCGCPLGKATVNCWGGLNREFKFDISYLYLAWAREMCTCERLNTCSLSLAPRLQFFGLPLPPWVHGMDEDRYDWPFARCRNAHLSSWSRNLNAAWSTSSYYLWMGWVPAHAVMPRGP